MALTRITITRVGAPVALTLLLAACSGGTGPTTSPTPGSRIPDGVYRSTQTEDQLLAAGVPDHDAEENDGTQELVVDSGRLTYRTVDNPSEPCVGTLEYAGAEVSFLLDDGYNCDGAGEELFAARWSLDGEDLVLDVVRSLDPDTLDVYLGTQPWERAH